MLETYNYIFYKSFRLVLFVALLYAFFKYFLPMNFKKEDMIKILIGVTVLFMFIDCYYPNIYYE